MDSILTMNATSNKERRHTVEIISNQRSRQLFYIFVGKRSKVTVLEKCHFFQMRKTRSSGFHGGTSTQLENCRKLFAKVLQSKKQNLLENKCYFRSNAHYPDFCGLIFGTASRDLFSAILREYLKGRVRKLYANWDFHTCLIEMSKFRPIPNPI